MPKRRRNPSVMKKAFASIPTVNIRRSVFNRSCGLKTTLPFDTVAPIFVDEVLPGDTFRLKIAHVMRMPALQVPIMDNMFCSIHFFYVPNRLLWKNWKDFITGSPEPWQWNSDYDSYGNVIKSYDPGTGLVKERTEKGSVLRVPQCIAPSNGYRRGSIYDLFGLPTGVGSFKHSALPLRAYDLIWNEYYRDENLQDSVLVLDGDDEKVTLTDNKTVDRLYRLRPRNKKYDYFTSAQPSPQKGEDSLVNLSVDSAYGITDSKAVNPYATPGFDRYPVHGFSIQTGLDGTLQVFPNGNIQNAGWTDLDVRDGVDSVSQATPSGTYYSTQSQLPTGNQSAWQGPGVYGNVSYYDSKNQIQTSFQKLSLISGANTPRVHWDEDVTPVNANIFTTPALNEQNWPIYVELPQASGSKLKASFSIADLRYAAVMQHWAEACARYGTRYNEAIAGHFGVQVGDYRVQRPEYLGGTRFHVNVSPVAQTSKTDGNAALGELGGIAASSGLNRIFNKSFVEHGLIIGLASFYADLTYYQGVDRNPWLRETRFDYYWPEFAHLGPQPIYNKEIFCKPDNATFNTVEESGYLDSDLGDEAVKAIPANYLPFGFQERYAEYRFKNSRVCGYMRPLEPGHKPSDTNWTFKNWLLTQEFEKDVRLNETFIQSNTPLNNILARQDNNGKVPAKYHVVMSDFYFDLKCVRPMPVYATPGLSRL